MSYARRGWRAVYGSESDLEVDAVPGKAKREAEATSARLPAVNDGEGASATTADIATVMTEPPRRITRGELPVVMGRLIDQVDDPAVIRVSPCGTPTLERVKRLPASGAAYQVMRSIRNKRPAVASGRALVDRLRNLRLNDAAMPVARTQWCSLGLLSIENRVLGSVGACPLLRRHFSEADHLLSARFGHPRLPNESLCWIRSRRSRAPCSGLARFRSDGGVPTRAHRSRRHEHGART